jgi:hypothetical protein
MKIITIETARLDSFKARWPCHGINAAVTHVVAAYDDEGDLLDCEFCNDAGENVGAGIDSGDAASMLLTDAFNDHDVTVIPGTIGGPHRTAR